MRYVLSVLAIFVARLAYSGLVHGPLFLHRLVYRGRAEQMRMNPRFSALVLAELLISVLLLVAYYIWRERGAAGVHRAGLGKGALFGGVVGLYLYLPQNLVTYLLFVPFNGPMFWSWFLAGLGSCALSGLLLAALWPAAQPPPAPQG